MWTKRELIDAAFAELALAGYAFDITPEEQQNALRRLDTMLATWDGTGVRLGYALPASPDDSDLDQPSGLPDTAVEAVYMHLAIRLASGIGKVLTSDQRRIAREAFAPLMRAAAQPQRQQLPAGMPLGAGVRRYPSVAAGTFSPPPDRKPMQITQGGDLQILPE